MTVYAPSGMDRGAPPLNQLLFDCPLRRELEGSEEGLQLADSVTSRGRP